MPKHNPKRINAVLDVVLDAITSGHDWGQNDSLAARVLDNLEAVDHLVALHDAVIAWRAAKCSSPGPRLCEPRDDTCDGDNHLETCAVELAREELLAAHNRCLGG